MKTSDLPGPAALLAPGNRDGQTKMVKDGGVISVHSWSESERKWTKIGDVVGQPEGGGKANNGAAPAGGKVTYEGREYDFVFDIDIDDGVVLKLPYNRTDEPWMIAQKFIHKHDLPQVYLDAIAQHIVKNSGLEPRIFLESHKIKVRNIFVHFRWTDFFRKFERRRRCLRSFDRVRRIHDRRRGVYTQL